MVARRLSNPEVMGSNLAEGDTNLVAGMDYLRMLSPGGILNTVFPFLDFMHVKESLGEKKIDPQTTTVVSLMAIIAQIIHHPKLSIILNSNPVK